MFLAAGGYRHDGTIDGKKMTALGHGCLKLKPLVMDKFKVVHSLESTNKEAISFEYKKRPGWFVRARDRGCYIEKREKEVKYGMYMLIVLVFYFCC